MRLQNRFQYDATLLGLEGKYEPIGNDSFLISSECVKVKQNVVTTGNTYFFVESDENQAVSATAVKLLDCFYFNGRVYLMLIDVFKGEVMLRNHKLDSGQKCSWRLADTHFMNYLMDSKEK